MKLAEFLEHRTQRAAALITFLDQNDTLVIPITANHILQGVKHDCNACPIALAVMEYGDHPYTPEPYGRLTRYPGVEVDRANIKFLGRKFACDRNVASWMSRFDHGEPVAPVTLLLSAYHPVGYQATLDTAATEAPAICPRCRQAIPPWHETLDDPNHQPCQASAPSA